MKKYLELPFIFLSKIYIFFYKDKNENWTIFPVLIMSTLITLNIEVLSFFLINLSVYYFVAIFISSIISLNIAFKNIEFNYVRDFEMAKKTKSLILGLMILDIIICFVFLNIARNGHFEF
jgi:hypothetical protein